MFMLSDYVCTGVFTPGFPTEIAKIVSIIIKVIQIGVPIALIIWGLIDLGKAVMAQKEDEIKAGQKTFLKRAVTAAIVFFVVVIVKLLVGVVAGDESTNIVGCIDEVLSL